ncbi:MAG: hypothetical protein MUO60_14550 [Clostridiaceae bacterium]|nr:hypothetical protein [Clostridiaceae bacterium]
MLHEIEIKGRGFNALKDFQSWRIAVLGYESNINSIEGINMLGKHFETDEVFVLIKGKAYMITSGYNDIPSDTKIIELKNEHMYVVKENQWHAALLEPGSKLLIIENQNTDDSNSMDHILSGGEKAIIQKEFKKYIQE